MGDLTPPLLDVMMRAWLAAREPALAARTVAAWADVSRSITAQSVRALIDAGGITEALSDRLDAASLDYIETVLLPYWRAAAEQGVSMAPALARSSLRPAALAEWLDARSVFLLDGLRQQQRQSITALVRHFTLDQPLGAGALAQILRPALGLTSRQALAIAAQYDAMIADGLDADTIALQLSRSAAMAQGVRAQRIARTELAAAHNAGTQITMKGALDAGVFAGDLERQWRTQRDERVCPTCGPLDAEVRGITEPFTGPIDLPPAHPSCRCVVTYREVR